MTILLNNILKMRPKPARRNRLLQSYKIAEELIPNVTSLEMDGQEKIESNDYS
jgi:hypothetical protein